MQQKIMYIFTRTPLHVGSGSSVGAIDQPIIRERHTGFPIIPGSSIKGVLRDMFRKKYTEQEININAVFGENDASGKISFGEARILAFPVRSAKGSFAMTTCPLALNRLKRDSGIIKSQIPDNLEPMKCLSGNKVVINKEDVVLEEYRFQKIGEFPIDLENELLALIKDSVWQEAKSRFVLLSDDDFTFFVQNTCEVNQHIAIDPEKGTTKTRALFNEEAVPSETLFYSTLTIIKDHEKNQTLINDLNEKIVQFGGSNTTGLGFCSISI